MNHIPKLSQSVSEGISIPIILEFIRKNWVLITAGFLAGILIFLIVCNGKSQKWEARASFLSGDISEALYESEILKSRDLLFTAAKKTAGMQLIIKNKEGLTQNIDSIPFKVVAERNENDYELEIKTDGSLELSWDAGSKIHARRGWLGIPMKINSAWIIIKPLRPGANLSMAGKWTLDFRSESELAGILRKNFKIYHYKSSKNKIQLSYKDSDPDRAMAFLNSHISSYQEKSIKKSTDSLELSIIHLNKVILQTEKELENHFNKSDIEMIWKLSAGPGAEIPLLSALDKERSVIQDKQAALMQLYQAGAFDEDFISAFSPHLQNWEDSLICKKIEDLEMLRLNLMGSDNKAESGMLLNIQELTRDILSMALKLYNDLAYQSQVLKQRIADQELKIKSKMENQAKALESLNYDPKQDHSWIFVWQKYLANIQKRIAFREKLNTISFNLEILEKPYLIEPSLRVSCLIFILASGFAGAGLVIIFLIGIIVMQARVVNVSELRNSGEISRIYEGKKAKNKKGKAIFPISEIRTDLVMEQESNKSGSPFNLAIIGWKEVFNSEEFAKELSTALNASNFNNQIVDLSGRADDLLGLDLRDIELNPSPKKDIREIRIFILPALHPHPESLKVIRDCDKTLWLLENGEMSRDELVKIKARFSSLNLSSPDWVFLN